VRFFDAALLRMADLLDDSLDQETPGRWTIVTDGDQQAPAVWAFVDGELRQTSNVWGGANNGVELSKPGTLALLTLAAGVGPTGMMPGSESWTDYQVSVTLRSDDDDAIGLVFRYADDDNWYRFSMDSERSYRRLVRCQAGVVSEIWSDTVAYAVGREYVVTIEANGDSLVGYLNGELVFAVRDGALTEGTIGLYCWGNTGARFGSVRVSSPRWATHYRFASGEGPLEAGSRVVVHSGAEADWNEQAVAGIRHRFAAVAPDTGSTHLSTVAPVRLRLRPSTGDTGHSRQFLPASAWSTVPAARVVRKADGTEFILVLPSGGAAASELASGTYRLALRYRRDNTAADPGSLVYTRGGDASDEVAALDTF
jgi:hypothetical protein